MKKRLIALGAVAVLAALVAGPQGAVAQVNGNHVFWIQGQSTIQTQHTYVWASPTQWDQDAAGNGPAAFGIPRPSTLPPTHTSTPCSLSRNTGPLGLNPPCAGTLTHNTLPGPQGCTEATNPTASCSFSGGTTWFYGYCGQTYGGASGITFSFSGQAWTITRMGFKRGSGAWEFNGIMARGSATAYIRMYLAAVPNNADEQAACDVTHNISSIYFQGIAIVSPQPLPAGLTRKPGGWNWCDGTDGC